MLTLRLSVFVLVAGVLAAGTLLAQHAYTPADIQEGERLFRANCVLCHGPEGDQIPGIDLGHGKFRQTYSEDALVKIIQEGNPGTAMPPNNLQDFQAEIVLAYLRSIASSGRSAPGNGDAARGKAIFEGKGGCRQCHRVGTQRLAGWAGSERHRSAAPDGRNGTLPARAERGSPAAKSLLSRGNQAGAKPSPAGC